MSDAPYIAHYYVDEAGDLSLFDKRGRSLVGAEGVSRTFMVGALELHNPEADSLALTALRLSLLSDPFFAGVPSMSPRGGKTALAFHAKDDLDTVRREVFQFIAGTPIKVFVGIRRKQRLVEEGQLLRARTGRKRSDSEIYDDLVTNVFKDRLHLADANHVVFARRGQSDRNTALSEALRRAKEGFNHKWKRGPDKPTSVASSVPSETPGLQMVDYCLWALQRMVERREDRYYNLIADKFRLVLDRDDCRKNAFGVYYTRRAPLSLEQLMPVL